MRQLTVESANKLQRILSKRLGRELSDSELEEAYDALMGFAVALLELGNDKPTTKSPPKKYMLGYKQTIANHQESVIQYV